METVRYGIIGLGNQGSCYAKDILMAGKTQNAVLTAICDINPEKIEILKGKIPEFTGASFTDYIEMIESGLCDAVLVETPHYAHPEITAECLRRGIHVLCDKPAGVYVKQVKEMNEVATNSNAIFGMMFNQRTNCLYRKMREMIANGKIGKLQRVNWIITDWYRTESYYASGGWRATWDGEGGGVLINQCPHQIDLVQWIVGEMPKTVRGFCGYGTWHDIEVEDEVTAYFTYESGATGAFITTTGEAPGTNRLEISGSKGKLLCEGGKLYFFENEEDSFDFCKTSPQGFARPKVTKTEVETDGQNPQHVGIMQNFTNAILGKEPLFVKGEEGVFGVELMNAIELSGWNNGEEITLPVDENRYLQELTEYRKNSVKKTAVNERVMDTSGSFESKKV
ncbi:MAG: Gfo/Idh/MocA family oxidoreductase [Clostridia bacterium]|nr:Gfo/Idh/MocA family oxidoreductase [Clostridia bacterium]